MASDMSGYQGAEGKRRWMQESGGDEAAYNREIAASQGAPSGAPDEAAIRAAAQGQSEDFGRFASDDLKRWAPNYDAAASQAAGRPQYRSSRGAPGFFDKPTECPEGQSPAGPDETSPCKDTDQLLAAQGAGVAQPGQAGTNGAGGGQPGSENYNPDDPLQARLMELMQSGGGSMGGIGSGAFTGGGGAMWQEGGPASSALTAATLNAFSPNAPSAQASGGGGAPAQMPGINASYSANPPVAGAPAAAPVASTAAPTPGLEGSLAGKQFRDPNEWWKRDPSQRGQVA